MDLRKIRMFLELRQFDVTVATGIPIGRLSQAERGLVALNRVEQASLEFFLRDRLREEFARFSGKTAKSAEEILELRAEDDRAQADEGGRR
ncbi:MAG TPA: hypothetical protein VEJ67_18480 [Candidatus Cybelea sp.]|nr:hypothetical protein [Candidatus Cybelea sp.]